MSGPRDDGGPAFPEPHDGTCGNFCRHESGMSLREYFVGQVIAGMAIPIGLTRSDYELIAASAYSLAGALLDKTQPQRVIQDMAEFSEGTALKEYAEALINRVKNGWQEPSAADDRLSALDDLSQTEIGGK